MPAIVMAALSNDLKASHRDAAPLDRAVVLLDDVVEIFVRANLDVAPKGVFASQQPQCSPTRYTWPSSVTFRGTRGGVDASALRKNACAAAMPRS